MQRKAHMKSDNILVVHLSHPVGDFMSRFNFLSLIQTANSNTKYYLLVEERFSELASLKFVNYELLFISRNKYRFIPMYRYKILKNLNKLNFKFVLNLSVDRGMFNDEISTKCNADQKIAIQSKSSFLSKTFNSLNNSHYTQILELDSQNEYEKLNNLKNILQRQLTFKISDDVNSKDNSRKDAYIVIAPFASLKEQEWPIVNYNSLAYELSRNYKLYFVGRRQRRHKNNVIINPRAINLINKTTLVEVYNLVSGSSLFIGNDSGLTHVAQVCNVRVIGIIGGGNYRQFFPNRLNHKSIYHHSPCAFYNCKWRCKFPQVDCMINVSMQSVYDSAIELLKVQ